MFEFQFESRYKTSELFNLTRILSCQDIQQFQVPYLIGSFSLYDLTCILSETLPQMKSYSYELKALKG
jgi:hypothetical protein